MFLETRPSETASGLLAAMNIGYLEAAQVLCRKYGTLFVLDEVQTGMFRTERFLAAHHCDLEPDVIVLAKALTGARLKSHCCFLCYKTDVADDERMSQA